MIANKLCLSAESFNQPHKVVISIKFISRSNNCSAFYNKGSSIILQQEPDTFFFFFRPDAHKFSAHPFTVISSLISGAITTGPM